MLFVGICVVCCVVFAGCRVLFVLAIAFVVCCSMLPGPCLLCHGSCSLCIAGCLLFVVCCLLCVVCLLAIAC